MKKNGLTVSKKIKIKRRLEAFHKATLGKTNFTKEEDDFIRKNYLHLPVKNIADKLGRSGTGVNAALKRMGLIIPREIIDRNKKQALFK